METKIKFYYVYVLLSLKDSDFYVGFTENLRKRFKEHNEGKNLSTKCLCPFDLIFYKAYRNKYDTLRREKYLKSTKGKTTLKSMLKEYLENKNK